MATRLLVATAVVVLVLAPAGVGAAPVGTAFTYQGALSDAGTPAEGVYDFRCALFDADYGGDQVGDTLFLEDVGVTGGLVNLLLDFGPVFDGEALWLEISVRGGSSTGAYTVLAPRQELTPAPYAAHASTATAAASAADAALLGGQSPSYYLDWSHLSGVPTDLLDGDADVLGGLACAAGEVAKWTGSAWTCSSAGAALSRTYVVGPSGTAAQNGAALLAALASIPTPSSQEEAALLKIEPGLYDLGSANLLMKPWVDVEGSGEKSMYELTQITADWCGAGAAVVVAGNSELRDLGVENTCAGTSAIGVLVDGDWASIRHVTIFVRGDLQYSMGLSVAGNTVSVWDTSVHSQYATTWGRAIQITGAGIVIEHTIADVWTAGADEATAIWVGGDSAWLSHVRASAHGGVENVAILGYADRPTLESVWARAEAGTANTAIWLEGPDDLEVRDVQTWNTDGTAIYLYQTQQATIRLRNVEMGGSPETGLMVGSGGPEPIDVTVESSAILGSTATLDLSGVTSLSVRVGSSRLAGGPPTITGTASLVCAGVYDENFTFYPDSCP